MLISTLGATLKRNLLLGKVAIRPGKDKIRAGEDTARAGQNF